MLKDLLVRCDPNRRRCNDHQEMRQAAHAGPSESLKRSLATAELGVRITHQTVGASINPQILPYQTCPGRGSRHAEPLLSARERCFRLLSLGV